MRCSVVYKFQCQIDSRFPTLKKTKQHLGRRLKEHTIEASAIYDRRLQCNCQYKPENFKIFDNANDDFSWCIKEASHIRRNKLVLNRNLANEGSVFSCKINLHKGWVGSIISNDEVAYKRLHRISCMSYVCCGFAGAAFN